MKCGAAFTIARCWILEKDYNNEMDGVVLINQ